MPAPAGSCPPRPAARPIRTSPTPRMRPPPPRSSARSSRRRPARTSRPRTRTSIPGRPSTSTRPWAGPSRPMATCGKCGNSTCPNGQPGLAGSSEDLESAWLPMLSSLVKRLERGPASPPGRSRWNGAGERPPAKALLRQAHVILRRPGL